MPLVSEDQPPNCQVSITNPCPQTLPSPKKSANALKEGGWCSSVSGFCTVPYTQGGNPPNQPARFPGEDTRLGDSLKVIQLFHSRFAPILKDTLLLCL